MGLYKYMGNFWKKHAESAVLYRERRIEWRKEPVTVRLERPTRLDRAHSLGYKAKSGIIIVRQRVDRGGRRRPDIKGGRRSKHARQLKILNKSYQAVTEGRASQKYPNMEVLNSYFVGKDGLHYWYEVILVDRSISEIAADKNLSWVQSSKGRVNRGLTSAGRKSRGLRHKGKGAEKLRPSKNASIKRKYLKQRRSYGY